LLILSQPGTLTAVNQTDLLFQRHEERRVMLMRGRPQVSGMIGALHLLSPQTEVTATSVYRLLAASTRIEFLI
jgi:hypothetical protein